MDKIIVITVTLMFLVGLAYELYRGKLYMWLYERKRIRVSPIVKYLIDDMIDHPVRWKEDGRFFNNLIDGTSIDIISSSVPARVKVMSLGNQEFLDGYQPTLFETNLILEHRKRVVEFNDNYRYYASYRWHVREK